MSNLTHIFVKDPFEIFEVGQSLRDTNVNSSGNKSPMLKIILVVLMIIGIAIVFLSRDIIMKFFLGDAPKRKIVKSVVQKEKTVKVEKKETFKTETANPDEGTGATIVV